ncbi:PaaI family thioesterase, partial [Brucella melitensis]|nr:PaaI family thioesterase [Brucella melitensis]
MRRNSLMEEQLHAVVSSVQQENTLTPNHN